MSLCLYWQNKPANQGLIQPPPVDPKKWKHETTVLAFQGTTLANCYKAFDASTYEKGTLALVSKLGVKLDVLYAICAAGGASPEWKFIQLGSTTHRNSSHNSSRHVYTTTGQGPSPEFVQMHRAAHRAIPLPCVDDPSAAGCPTEPPVMFPYTPTATLSVEILGNVEDV